MRECLTSQIYFGQIGYVIKKNKIKQLDDEGEFEVETVMNISLEKESSFWIESHYNHSDEILNYLKRAYISAKKLNSHRLFLFMGAEIAREHFRNNRYDLARPLFDTLIEEFKKEKWNALLFSVLLDALKCAENLNLKKESLNYCYNILLSKNRLPPRILIFIALNYFGTESSQNYADIQFKFFDELRILSTESDLIYPFQDLCNYF
jgi:hypothetical protein